MRTVTAREGVRGMGGGRLARRPLALLLILAVALAACGGGAAGLPKGAEGRTKVSVVLDWYPWANHSGLFLAQSRGYFKDEGLEVDIHPPSNPEDILKVVAAGTDQFGISYQPDVLSARAAGVPVKSIAALVQHPLNTVMTPKGSGIARPKDLEGKKVGTRGYTVTPGIWIRGILQLEHGVDLDRIAWVANDEEHVAEYTSHDPPNVTRQLGANLNQMLADGELAAGLWAKGDGDHINPFYPDPDAAAREFYQRYGVFPIDHLIVVKDSLLEEHPWLARALYEALKAAKTEALRRDPHAHIGGAGIIAGDPLPYGLEANRKALQMLLDMCLEQRVLQQHTTLEELFPLRLD